jgi:hypothetical protein
MKSIVCVNISIPTIEDYLSYDSGGSLRDYDMVIFSPTLPYYSRIDFTGGGSCISIEGTQKLTNAFSHWATELKAALVAGKTVFIVLDSVQEDRAAITSSMASKTERAYNTAPINSYSIVPGNLRVKNTRGRKVISKDSAFKSLFDPIKNLVEYRVVFESTFGMRTVYAAKDGTPVGGVVNIEDLLGSLVLLPHFDFEIDEFTEFGDGGEEVWNTNALKASHNFVAQLANIDKVLRKSSKLTVPPTWIEQFPKPHAIAEIDSQIDKIESEIAIFDNLRRDELLKKAELEEYLLLLYESGDSLEFIVEKAMRLLGYAVENLRIGDLEIDHVMTGPSGKRMIGETEGKDTSAIDINKFRQLESNIGEDFEREEVDMPAKGVLFGNGYRLTEPKSRPEQFTKKCLTNAGRLGSALVRTSDLYLVILKLLNKPDDEEYRSSCRSAIEDAAGGIVHFPISV